MGYRCLLFQCCSGNGNPINYPILNNDLIDDTNFGYGHGTHVAGTIGATGNNGYAVTGVNQQVSIMGIKAIAEDGSTDDVILYGIQYIVVMKNRGVNIRAVNASLGGEGSCSQAWVDALWVLFRKNISFVAAAGNGGDDGIGDNNNRVP